MYLQHYRLDLGSRIASDFFRLSSQLATAVVSEKVFQRSSFRRSTFSFSTLFRFKSKMQDLQTHAVSSDRKPCIHVVDGEEHPWYFTLSNSSAYNSLIPGYVAQQTVTLVSLREITAVQLATDRYSVLCDVHTCVNHRSPLMLPAHIPSRHFRPGLCTRPSPSIWGGLGRD